MQLVKKEGKFLSMAMKGREREKWQAMILICTLFCLT